MSLIFLLACLKKSSPQLELSDKQFCTLTTEWRDCLEKDVSLSASVPNVVMQHPILAAPMGDDSIQNYITVGERQIIALSNIQNPCAKNFVVQGLLKEISLGGPAGTRGSYSNYYLSNTQFVCK